MAMKTINLEDIGDMGDDDFIISSSIPTATAIEESTASAPSLEQNESEKLPVRCEFLTGGAGTGKTTEIKRRMEQYPVDYPNRERKYGLLAATTGIAAINLGEGVTTINSLLRFFDIESLEDSYTSGKLHQALKEVAKHADNLIIDEVSMMHAKAADIIWDAVSEINQLESIQDMGGLGLVVVGDFCQLPPVPEKDVKTGKPQKVKYFFEALCWGNFEKATTKLEKVWRQDDPEFIKALNHARRGEGEECVTVLKNHKGVNWSEQIDNDFDGTTIFSKNAEVDRHNQSRLRNLLHGGKHKYEVKNYRWGKQRGEWKNIPETLEVCDGCYVMVLANDTKMKGFRYANGSTGYVEKFYSEEVGEVGERAVDRIVDVLQETKFRGENVFEKIENKTKEGTGSEGTGVGVVDPDLEGLDLGEWLDDQSIRSNDIDSASDDSSGDSGVRKSAGRLKQGLTIAETPIDELIDESGTPNTFLIKLRDKVDVAGNPLKVEIGKICRQCTQKDHLEGKPKPEFDSFKEWKDKHSGEFTTAKQGKYLYELFLVGLTEEGKKGSHRYKMEVDASEKNSRTVCSCGWSSPWMAVIEFTKNMEKDWKTPCELAEKHRREQPNEVYYNYSEERWVTGEIYYYPLRIAYASTVHKCVALGSYVNTKVSGLQIAQDALGYIDTGIDGFRAIQAKQTTLREGVRIRTELGLELIVSKEHPILVRDVGFVEAGKLEIGYDVKLATYADGGQDIDCRIAWLLGALVGDGCYTDQREGNLHFCNSDFALQELFINIINDQGIHANRRSDNRGCFSTSKPFRDKLAKMGLDYVKADEKVVPKIIMESNNLGKANFLQGLMDTDGSVRGKGRGLVYCTVSYQLSRQVQLLFLCLGIQSKRGMYPGANGPYYQVSITSNGVERYKEIIGFNKPDKVEALENYEVKRIFKSHQEYDQVVDIAEIGNLVMIDFEVEGEHVFAIDGVVTHNSQGLTLDRVQIDFVNQFFGQPSMAYVALSRVRTAEGLRLVGNPRMLVERVNVDKKVVRFI